MPVELGTQEYSLAILDKIADLLHAIARRTKDVSIPLQLPAAVFLILFFVKISLIKRQ